MLSWSTNINTRHNAVKNTANITEIYTFDILKEILPPTAAIIIIIKTVNKK